MVFVLRADRRKLIETRRHVEETNVDAYANDSFFQNSNRRNSFVPTVFDF
jgi:hypothetical protein